MSLEILEQELEGISLGLEQINNTLKLMVQLLEALNANLPNPPILDLIEAIHDINH